MYDKMSVHPANKQVISYMVNLCAKDFIGRKYLIIKKNRSKFAIQLWGKGLKFSRNPKRDK